MANTTNTVETEYRVFWTNHGYFSEEAFASFEDAIAYAKKHFEASIYEVAKGTNPYTLAKFVGQWTVFGGTRKSAA